MLFVRYITVICVLTSVCALGPVLESVNANPLVGNPEENALSYQVTTTTATTTVTTTTYPCEYSQVFAEFELGIFPSYLVYQSSNNQAPSCIYNTLAQAYNDCYYRVGVARINGSSGMVLLDDCIAWVVFGAQTHSAPWASYSSIYYGARYDWASYATRTVTAFRSRNRWGDITYTYSDSPSTLYIRRNPDGSCSPVSNVPASAQACYAGTYHWYVSPISLLWDDEVDINNDLRFTNFPLDPHRGDMVWSVWKASGHAPLLVYDPEHKGLITSATQLLGDWAFGGKLNQQAKADRNPFFSLKMSDFEMSANTTKWKDGYEALSTLDSDNNGSIDGDELNPLALWFDYNRNGVSESGEVKSLAEVDVVALYYNANREEKSSGNIYADIGYKRIIDGKAVIRGSVDWKSDVSTTKAELINKHLALGLGCLGGRPSLSNINDLAMSGENGEQSWTSLPNFQQRCLGPVSDQLLSKIPVENENLSGVWIWTTNSLNDSKKEPEGYFGLADAMDGTISGHAYTSFAVNNKASNFTNIFSSFRFQGVKLPNKDGTFKVQFVIKPDDLSNLENEAIYDAKEQKITGTTRAKVSAGTTPIDITYSWTARRINQR